MTGTTFESLFPDGGHLVYRLRSGPRALGRQWLRPIGQLDDGGRVIEVLLEIDRAAVGAKGGVRRQRGALVVHPDGSPRVYRHLRSDGSRAFGFGPDDIVVTLVDGRTASLPRAGAEFLADAHIPGFLALMLAAIAGRLRDGPVVTARLHVAQILVAPCTVTATPGGARTSHGEELVLDEGGVMVAAHMPRRGLSAERILAPLPSWIDDPAARVLVPPNVYRSPPGLRVDDAVVPVPGATVIGALSVPDRTPAPGALFIGGTGKPNRHGITSSADAGSHEIMDGLAQQGVLGLRCDALGASRVAELCAAAEAQLAFLASHPLVVRGRLFLIGHSQGGAVALTLAAERPDLVRGVVLLATSGRPFDVVVTDQVRRLAVAHGWPDTALAAELEDLQTLFEAATAGRPLVAGEVPDHLLLRARDQPWLADRLARSNADRMSAVRCPVLVCQGEEDIQVSVADAETLVAAGRAAGIAVTLARFSDLDHWLRSGPAAHVPKAVIRTIADWIAAAH